MNWDPASAHSDYGTFMPALIWAVEHTEGPILELGAGYFSTPYLFIIGKEREVVSYEFDLGWARAVRRQFPNHTVVTDFDDVPLREWAVVLVDCEGWNRKSFFNALKPATKVFIIHDSQDPWVDTEDMQPFTYHHSFGDSPRTTLLSNGIDVRGCGC